MLKWLGAAAVLVVVAALIASLVYNSVQGDDAPTPTVAVTELATTPSTAATTSSTSSTSSTTSTSTSSTTIVATSTSGP